MKYGQVIIVTRQGGTSKQLWRTLKCCHGSVMEETYKIPQGSHLSVQTVSLLNNSSLCSILSVVNVNVWTRSGGLRIGYHENLR